MGPMMTDFRADDHNVVATFIYISTAWDPPLIHPESGWPEVTEMRVMTSRSLKYSPEPKRNLRYHELDSPLR